MSDLRSNLQNTGIAFIVIFLSAVFVLQFGGPQAEGCSGNTGSKYAADVYGDVISLGEMRSAYVLANGPSYKTSVAKEMRLKELVLEGLIERDLLAREARNVGFDEDQDAVMVRLAENGTIFVSAAVRAPYSFPRGALPIDLTDKDGNFSVDTARRFIQNRLGRSVEEFALSQIQETLAQRMRETVSASVTIAPSEIWAAFVRERDRVTLDFVRFDAAFYTQLLAVTTADLDAYVAAHDAELSKAFEKEKHRFTGLEKQVRARHILIKAADAASKPAARVRAEALRKRAVAGEDFATLAGENSEDPGSAKQGGDLGYNPKGRMVPAFDTAQFALAPGQVSEVVESQFGFHVIKVEAVREGDVPVAEAKRELAETLYRDQKASELAKQAADTVQARLAAGTTVAALELELEAAKTTAADSALAPVVKQSRAFGRSDNPIPGLEAQGLVELSFALDAKAPLGKEPFKAGSSFVVYSLRERVEPKREEFDGGERDRLADALLGRKRKEALDVFVIGLRKRADDAGAVKINPVAIRYEGGDEAAL